MIDIIALIKEKEDDFSKSQKNAEIGENNKFRFVEVVALWWGKKKELKRKAC